MGFRRTTRRLHLRSPTLASRSRLRMAVDRPVGILLGMSFKWPVSRCRISPLVCPQRPSYRVFNDRSLRLMRSDFRWFVNSTCIGTLGPRLASTIVLRCHALLAGPVPEQRFGSATHGLLSHALPKRDRSESAGIGGVFTLGLSKVQLHAFSELIIPP